MKRFVVVAILISLVLILGTTGCIGWVHKEEKLAVVQPEGVAGFYCKVADPSTFLVLSEGGSFTLRETIQIPSPADRPPEVQTYTGRWRVEIENEKDVLVLDKIIIRGPAPSPDALPPGSYPILKVRGAIEDNKIFLGPIVYPGSSAGLLLVKRGLCS